MQVRSYYQVTEMIEGWVMSGHLVFPGYKTGPLSKRWSFKRRRELRTLIGELIIHGLFRHRVDTIFGQRRFSYEIDMGLLDVSWLFGEYGLVLLKAKMIKHGI